jgi:hypothetical protein
MTIIIRALLAVGLFVVICSAQPAGILSSTTNVPCNYSWAGINGDTGCSSGGSCNPQMIGGPSSISAGWHESWYCDNGYVEAMGESYITYELWFNSDTGQSTSYPTGLLANGRAVVYLSLQITTYNGHEESTCDGWYDFSGPYYYRC